MQFISDDKTIRSDTIQGLKDFFLTISNNTSQNGGQLVSMIPAIKKPFDLMVDDIVKNYTENDALEIKTGSNDEKSLEESKAKLLKQIDDEKRAKLIMSRMKKQMKKL